MGFFDFIFGDDDDKENISIPSLSTDQSVGTNGAGIVSIGGKTVSFGTDRDGIVSIGDKTGSFSSQIKADNKAPKIYSSASIPQATQTVEFMDFDNNDRGSLSTMKMSTSLYSQLKARQGVTDPALVNEIESIKKQFPKSNDDIFQRAAGFKPTYLQATTGNETPYERSIGQKVSDWVSSGTPFEEFHELDNPVDRMIWQETVKEAKTRESNGYHANAAIQRAIDTKNSGLLFAASAVKTIPTITRFLSDMSVEIDRKHEEVTGHKFPFIPNFEIDDKINEMSIDMIDYIDDYQQNLIKHTENKELAAAVQGVTSMIAAVGVGVLTKSPAAAAAMLSTVESSDFYNEAREAGKSPEESFAIASIAGVGTYLLEKFGLDYVMRPGSPGRSVFTELLKKGTFEAGQEDLQQVWQNLVALFGYDKTRGLFDGLYESTIGGFFGGSFGGAVIAGIGARDRNRIINRITSELRTSGVDEGQAKAAAVEMLESIEKNTEILRNVLTTPIKQDSQVVNAAVRELESARGKVPRVVKAAQQKAAIKNGVKTVSEIVNENREIALIAQDAKNPDQFFKDADAYVAKNNVDPTVDLGTIYRAARSRAGYSISKLEARRIVTDLAGDLGIDVEFVRRLTTPEGEAALGRFVRGVEGVAPHLIQIVDGKKGIHKSTPYHEVGHLYFRELMTNAERRGVLDQVKKAHRSSEMSDLEAEEHLVQDLAAYQTKKEARTAKYGKVLSSIIEIAQKLVDAIRGNKISQFYEKVLSRERPSMRKKRQIQREKKGIKDVQEEYWQKPDALTSKFFNYKEIAGRETISYQHAKGSLKGAGLKEFEKKLIESVLDNQFKDEKRISMTALKNAVHSELMPLEIIESEKYAEYGSDGVGLEYTNQITHIYDSRLDHGLTGHFSSDYKDLYSVETLGKQELDKKYGTVFRSSGKTAIRSSTGEDLHIFEDNNMSVYEKEKYAEEWIKKNKPSLLINKGLFGHTRVWDTDTYSGNEPAIRYVAEVQSDVFQGGRYKQKLFEPRIEAIEADLANLNKIQSEMDSYKYIVKGDRVHILKEYGGEKLDDYIDDVRINPAQKTEEEMIDEAKDYYQNKIERDIKNQEGRLGELKASFTTDRKKMEEQFAQYRNIWHERIIKEEIRLAALDGKDALRFPFPRTVARIEGYGSGEGVRPYDLMGNYPDVNLEVGDRIEYGGTEMTVIEAGNYGIKVVETDKIRVENEPVENLIQEDVDYYKEEAISEIRDMLKDFGLDPDALTSEQIENLESQIEELDLFVKVSNAEKRIKDLEDKVGELSDWQKKDLEKQKEYAKQEAVKPEWIADDVLERIVRNGYYTPNYFDLMYNALSRRVGEEGTISLDDVDQDFEENLYREVNDNWDPEAQGYDVYYEGDYVTLVEGGALVEEFEQPYRYEPTEEDFDINNFDGSQKTVLEFYDKKVLRYLEKLRKGNVEEVEGNEGFKWLETKITADDIEAVEAFQTEDVLSGKSEGSAEDAQNIEDLRRQADDIIDQIRDIPVDEETEKIVGDGLAALARLEEELAILNAEMRVEQLDEYREKGDEFYGYINEQDQIREDLRNPQSDEVNATEFGQRILSDVVPAFGIGIKAREYVLSSDIPSLVDRLIERQSRSGLTKASEGALHFLSNFIIRVGEIYNIDGDEAHTKSEDLWSAAQEAAWNIASGEGTRVTRIKAKLAKERRAAKKAFRLSEREARKKAKEEAKIRASAERVRDSLIKLTERAEARLREMNKKGVKPRVRRATGQTDTSPKVTFTERQLLREQLRIERRAASLGAREAKKEITEKNKQIRDRQKVVGAAEKLAKHVRKAITRGKSIHVEFGKKILDLIENYDFQKPNKKTMDKFAKMIEELKNGDLNPEIAKNYESQLERLNKKPIADMTVEEIAEFNRTIKQLVELGKLKLEMVRFAKAEDRAVRVARLVESTVNRDPVGVKRNSEKFRDKVNSKRWSMRFFHAFRNADYIDGDKLYDGENVKMQRSLAMAEIRAKTESNKSISETIQAVQNLKHGWTESEFAYLSARLRKREGAMDQVEIIENKYGIKADAKKVDALDAETADEIIDLLSEETNKNAAEYAAVYEARENKPFTFIDGYVMKLKYEEDEHQAFEAADVRQTVGRTMYSHKTPDGSTVSRQKGVKKIPRIDVFQIFAETIQEQNWYRILQPVIDDIHTLVTSEEYIAKAGEVVSGKGGFWDEYLSVIAHRGWAANTEPVFVLRKLRTNLTYAILGYRGSSALIQPFAIFDAISYVYMKYGSVAASSVAYEFSKTLVNPMYKNGVLSQSDALKLREGEMGEVLLEEVAQAYQDSLVKKSGAAQLASRAWNKWQRGSMALLKHFDMQTASSVWNGVYKALLSQGMSKEEATKEADFVMQITNGSSEVSDRPLIYSKGDVARSFMIFQTFALSLYGLIHQDVVRAGIIAGLRGGEYDKFVRGIIGLLIIAFGQVMGKEFRDLLNNTIKGKDQRTAKEMIEELPKRMATSVVGLFPILGQMAEGYLEYGQSSGGLSSPITSMLSQIIRGSDQAVNGKTDKSRAQGAILASEGLVGLWLGVGGTAQVADIVEGVLRRSGATRSSKGNRLIPTPVIPKPILPKPPVPNRQ